jgi:ankyrin repeat protein
MHHYTGTLSSYIIIHVYHHISCKSYHLFPRPSASTSASSRMKLNDERDLMTSCERGNLQNVKRFIMKGVNIECRDSMLNTPIICASHYGHCDIVSTLLEANADKDAVNRNGTSSLLAASFYGHFSIVQILLEHRADESLEDRHGDSALIKAADSGYEAICAIILMYGANYMKLKKWLNKTSPSSIQTILPNTAVVAGGGGGGRAKGGGSILNLANQQQSQGLGNIRKLVAQMPIIWISYIFAQGLNIALDAIDIENMFQFY